MVIGVFGVNCTGKSTIVNELSMKAGAIVYTGKDYLRLAKSEAEAKTKFVELLSKNEDSAENLIYVISEKEHLSFLPDKAVRILITADIKTIKERFAQRMNGVLPPPIATMLENKYDTFLNERYDMIIDTSSENTSDSYQMILNLLSCKKELG